MPNMSGLITGKNVDICSKVAICTCFLPIGLYIHVHVGAWMCSSTLQQCSNCTAGIDSGNDLKTKCGGGEWDYKVIGRVEKVIPLTRWCHWEQVHSWLPIYATEQQWWRLTAEACADSSRRCSPSQCWRDTNKGSIYMLICSDILDSLSGPQLDDSHRVLYSHSGHPLVTECHKSDAQPRHGDSVLLRIKLIRPFFL